MKKRIIFLLIYLLWHDVIKAQSSPYTGGNGSGYQSVISQLLTCSLFAGGEADGYAVNRSPIVTCPMYYGDSASSSASNHSAFTVCALFFGGSGDGYDSRRYQFCQVLLPLKILDFSGVKETNRNMLYWRVADAQDLRWFEVERSSNGVSFIKIGTVNASGTNYQFSDNSPLPSINYYRLRIVEQNNRILYSGVVALRSFTGSQFTVYPNPAKEHVNVYYYSTVPITTAIGLYSMSEGLVLQQRVHLRKGSNYLLLHFENIKPGVYMLIIQETGDKAKLVLL